MRVALVTSWWDNDNVVTIYWANRIYLRKLFLDDAFYRFVFERRVARINHSACMDALHFFSNYHFKTVHNRSDEGKREGANEDSAARYNQHS